MGRILTTHAGSLPRPADLDAALARRSRGETVEADHLSELTRSATADVVRHQCDAGVDIAGNGEQGRESFFTHVRDRFTGFGGLGEVRPFRDAVEFPAYARRRRALLDDPGSVSLAQLPAAVEDIKYLGTSAILEEIETLRAEAAGKHFADLFLTVPSPGIIAAAMTNRHYTTIDEYVDALAEGLAHEYRAIVDAGLILQIDAPDLALERHVLFADKPVDEFRSFAEHVVGAINGALGSSPRDRVRLHVCWGNYDGPHVFDVPLAEMLDIYEKAHVGSLVLSLANPRHAHEYRLLSGLAPRFAVVAGCVDTTSNYVEHPQVVADRLLRVAGALGEPGRLQAGTDCGFGTAAGARDVAPDVAWAKLAALVEGAAVASEALGLA